MKDISFRPISSRGGGGGSGRSSASSRRMLYILLLIMFVAIFVILFLFRNINSSVFRYSAPSSSIRNNNKNNKFHALSDGVTDKDEDEFTSSTHQFPKSPSKFWEKDDDFLSTQISSCPKLPDFEKLQKQEDENEQKFEQEAEQHKRARLRRSSKESDYPAPSIQGDCSAPALCHIFLRQLKSRRREKNNNKSKQKKRKSNAIDDNEDDPSFLEKERGNWWLPYSKGGRILHHDDDGFARELSRINDEDFDEEHGNMKQRIYRQKDVISSVVDDDSTGKNKKNGGGRKISFRSSTARENQRIPKSKSELAVATLFASRKEGDALENQVNNGDDLYSDDSFLNDYVSTDYLSEVKTDIVNSKRWWKRLYFMSFVNKAMYVLRRKYDLIVEGNPIVDWSRNSPAWSKLLVLDKWMDHYSWILWCDSDSFFMNHRIPFSIFLPRKVPTNRIRKDKNFSLAAADENDSDEMVAVIGTEFSKKSRADILIAKDYRSWNTGVWFLRGDVGGSSQTYKNGEFLLQQRNLLKQRKVNQEHEGEAEIDRNNHMNNKKKQQNNKNKNFNQKFYDRDYFTKNFLHQMWEITDQEALPFHDQGAFLKITDADAAVASSNHHTGGKYSSTGNNFPSSSAKKVQIIQNAFHVVELEAKMINSYPAPLLAQEVDESKWHRYQYIDGESWIAHFPSCIKYETCPGWLESLFSSAVCSNSMNGGDATVKEEWNVLRYPPPPSILARRNYSNIRIMESSFRVLGQGLRP